MKSISLSRAVFPRMHPRALVLALAALAGASAACAQQAPAPAPAPAQAAAQRQPPPARSTPPMDLAGQKVLVLPVQAVSGIPQSRDDVTREVLFALGERDTRTHFIPPSALRSALQSAPGYADDPDDLPADPFRHHQERYVIDPLAGVLRRYSALMDTRLVLVIPGAQWLPAPAGAQGGVIRMSAVMIDSRTGNVVWYGEADGDPRPGPDAGALGTAAASLAARMLVAR